jgi:hypothetical protein
MLKCELDRHRIRYEIIRTLYYMISSLQLGALHITSFEGHKIVATSTRAVYDELVIPIDASK